MHKSYTRHTRKATLTGADLRRHVFANTKRISGEKLIKSSCCKKVCNSMYWCAGLSYILALHTRTHNQSYPRVELHLHLYFHFWLEPGLSFYFLLRRTYNPYEIFYRALKIFFFFFSLRKKSEKAHNFRKLFVLQNVVGIITKPLTSFP